MDDSIQIPPESTRRVSSPCSSDPHPNQNVSARSESNLRQPKFLLHSSPSDASNHLIQRHPALRRLDSMSYSSCFYTEYPERYWIDDPLACEHLFSMLTSMYAMVILVFSIVIELSQKFTPEEWIAETMFYSYMYGTGILFLIYCYLFMIHPQWYNLLITYCNSRGWLNDSKVYYFS
uniref:Uncharacterized protein n=1 Tax=Panagrolaimus sp. JU765 TaxID=591449 RepID=A0AC34RCB5_9BILA